ncbi:MAG TPA: hypothetical protein VF006_28490 [Longimicrobium sp.]
MIEPYPAWMQPLLRVSRRLEARHLSLFGSYLLRRFSEVGDVDVHVVIPRLDARCFAQLRTAARAVVDRLAREEGGTWGIELRHGPLKPSGRTTRERQLHLVIDDEASLDQTPCVVLAQRAANGLLLLGDNLDRYWLGRDAAAVRRHEAHVELSRWREGLARNEIPFRQWVFDPEARLVEGSSPATTPRARQRLLRSATQAADLHYLIALAADLQPDELALVGTTPTRRALSARLDACIARLRAMPG